MPSRPFHYFSLFTVAMGLLLIWWGAAVTTEDVGLSVPDWPLCFGRINPEGWYKVPAILLEHGHRLIAAAVGVLVLIQYFWQFARCQPRISEAAGIILGGVALLYLAFHRAVLPAGCLLILGAGWLITTWICNRWTLLRGLTTMALILVILQASLGGLRVLKLSDPFGIVHGTLGQLFFCLLVLIAFASSRTWRHGRLILDTRTSWRARGWSLALFVAVFLQLVIGAMLRHTQRDHLAASDILTTQGHIVPPLEPTDAFVLFLHKDWGFVVAALLIIVALKARHWLGGVPKLRWIPAALVVLPVVQVTLGIYVILTGKSFWVTNFHVLNGLGLLVLSFLLMIPVWASSRSAGVIAEAEADKVEGLA